MPRREDPNELGALWSKNGSHGEYLTGEVNGVKVVCFSVGSDNPKAPKWRVLKSQPKEQREEKHPPEDDFADGETPF